MTRLRPARRTAYVLLTAGAAAWLAPFAWMVLGSAKTQDEIFADPPTWWPRSPTGGNFARWLTELHFGTFFGNSLLVAVLTVLGNLLFCSMAGYALAKMDFAGKRLLLGVVLVTIMVPGVVTFVPLFVIVAKLGILNTYGALVLPFLTQPVGVFLMRQFMLDIPDSLLEAARIDGASEPRIFTRIVLPLCGPALATLGILTFLGSWNNFLWPLVAGQSESMYTLPVALSLYSTGQYATDYGTLLSGAVLIITPILALFVALQRHFVQGIATVGLK
ncbi:carbohydrate ABC transporter permease [Actinomadura sp. ATCC 31491]|uniref:Carbohydrate ABC transporter permease n=1 Tax=Actinomadura luzonensis TaxID=2805427 RepID=A0ABT0FUM8_9ACTN|nr:carbohydrate ABC transporter permease [Actinomadura luzonensis]MCK2216039.1 carbohydrate ABC transporter permease [Actinomadura luzonensis]